MKGFECYVCRQIVVYLLNDRTTGFISLNCFMLLREGFFLNLIFENTKLGFIESGDDSAQEASKLLNGK